MLARTLRKYIAIALTLLIAGHLFATHADHPLDVGHHDGADTSHQSFQSHAHYDVPQDLDSQALPASNPCPLPTVVGQRIDPEFDLVISCQAIGPLVNTMASVPIELPVRNDLPRPAGPDRQAILQRFTL